MSIRRRIAIAIAAVGVVFVGSRLESVWPRSVEIAYEVGPDNDALDVDYVQGDVAIASVRFAQSSAKRRVFMDTVRLQPGEYEVHITRYGHDRPAIVEVRQLTVPTYGVTRFDLEHATRRSE